MSEVRGQGASSRSATGKLLLRLALGESDRVSRQRESAWIREQAAAPTTGGQIELRGGLGRRVRATMGSGREERVKSACISRYTTWYFYYLDCCTCGEDKARTLAITTRHLSALIP